MIIRMFRAALVREPAVEDIPKIFRAVIIQLLEGRPTEETLPEWVRKNLTRLRPTARIMPLRETDSVCSTSSTASTQTFQVENLPV